METYLALTMLPGAILNAIFLPEGIRTDDEEAVQVWPEKGLDVANVLSGWTPGTLLGVQDDRKAIGDGFRAVEGGEISTENLEYVDVHCTAILRYRTVICSA